VFRTEAGSAFHAAGPAIVNELSARRVLVRRVMKSLLKQCCSIVLVNCLHFTYVVLAVTRVSSNLMCKFYCQMPFDY